MKLFQSIWSLLEMMGDAKYAAFLARNGQYKKAQALYKN